ncbi:heme peroxidase [Pavlovales sp. CCMP2436]|nr:heme peroxidase [Pavlovales sp. CCMP2436]
MDGQLAPSRRSALVSVGSFALVSAVGMLDARAASAAAPAKAATEEPLTDVQQAAAEIKALIKKSPDKGPTLVRLAWHSSGTYDEVSRDGGSGPGTIRFKEELAHGANAGLAAAIGWLEPIKRNHAKISYADLFTLAGVVAIKQMGGPTIPWKSGRTDGPVTKVTPDGRLPAADKGSDLKTADGLREVFGRMGFGDKDIVALSGAHALGRCHPDASGYSGPWTPTPTLLTTAYFSLLLNTKWTSKKWDGPFQYEDPSGKLMMLPSDLVLVKDAKFKKYVELYAKDAKAFYADFSKAYARLLELGTQGLTPTVYV